MRCTKPKKISGLIYLEDASSGPLPKLSRHSVELLDKCLEGPNVILATTGWNDSNPTKALEARHEELREQWKPFVDRGASVIRLAAPGKTSKEVSHRSEDIFKLVITKAEEMVTAAKRSQWKGKGKVPDDKFLEDARSTDIVIPIMGPTGAGKSTFVNAVANNAFAVVGHNLKSETAQLQPIILQHPNNPARRIIIVDTPGFDDTYAADSEILRRIANWLAQSYSANMTLAGVIYLHEISQARMLGTARKNLDMFNKLCGDAATKNVILATTKWSQVAGGTADRREGQLKDRHWDGMIRLGARMARFTDTHESGWNIIGSILDHMSTSDIDAVEIQKELVEIDMSHDKGKQWKKEVKSDDVFIDDGKAGDLFINNLLGKDVARVGDDLQSETQHIHHYRLPGSSSRVFIVDTPGFDDTSTSDREILRRIAVWMAKSYSSDMKVAGIIYLQEITQTRVTGTMRKNLDMFEKLCGPSAAASIILATSKWSEVKPDVGNRREAQLRDEHWKDMLMDGSKLRRFDSPDAARKIVNEIRARKALDAAQIQSELVDVDKLLAETDAGRTLRYTLKELLEQQKKTATRLREQGGDDIHNQIIENDNKIRSLLGQVNDLKVPLSRKIMRMLGLVKS
ncbi:hypothetical protein H0H87_009453 [Tephrocybe sp. NHM501043]|nr:hypothetical protein H0H87_009453 [Tephrocybe sp. NHM501043]